VIDFRYHLVSIIAVFLALAIGIVVGSTALQGGTEDILRHAVNAVTHQNNALRQTNNLLKQQVSADQNFAQAGAGRLLDGLLVGQKVVLVTAPGADSQTINGVSAAVKRAGAKVTGQVSLTPQFFDTSAGTETSLTALAQQLAPAGMTVSGQQADTQIAGQEAAARVLAAALVTKDGPLRPTAQTDSSVLSGFGQRGFLQVSATSSSRTLAPATLAIAVIPATPPVNDTSPANLGLIAVAEALQAASDGTVMAGSVAGSGPGSAIDAMSSGAVSGSVTTVDNADTQIGDIAVAQALRELLTGHKPAAYGVRTGVFPSPAPSPPATAATSFPSSSTAGNRRTAGRHSDG
jgi:Copper transport outer membrane protein, MctB